MAIVFMFHEHIRFQIVSLPESRNQLIKRGETEKPYD
jgi:hypothetical protein